MFQKAVTWILPSNNIIVPFLHFQHFFSHYIGLHIFKQWMICAHFSLSFPQPLFQMLYYFFQLCLKQDHSAAILPSCYSQNSSSHCCVPSLPAYLKILRELLFLLSMACLSDVNSFLALHLLIFCSFIISESHIIMEQLVVWYSPIIGFPTPGYTFVTI